MPELKPLSRDQLAQFLPNHEAIRAFEKLFRAAGGEITEEMYALTGAADAKAQEALEILHDFVGAASAALTSTQTLTEQNIAGIADLHQKISALLALISAGDAQLSAEDAALAGIAEAKVTALTARLEEAATLIRAAEARALQPFEQNNQPAVDYVDFRLMPPHADVAGRVNWNADEETLNLHHGRGVVQQVGQEAYARVTNNTITTFINGRLVGLAGVGSGSSVSGQLYIADGSMPSIYVIGVATENIFVGNTGFVTVRGLVHDLNTNSWNVGDILYASPTVAGLLTNVKPTAPNLVVPVAIVLVKSSTVGVIAVRPTIFPQLYYGSFDNGSSQTAAAANTAYGVIFNNTIISAGVSVGTPNTRLVTANSGLYNFTFTVQAAKSTASVGYIWLWGRKNGVDIANSAGRSAIQGANGEALITRTFTVSMAASDYFELMWAVDATTISLLGSSPTAFAPGAPSATMTVNQVNQ